MPVRGRVNKMEFKNSEIEIIKLKDVVRFSEKIYVIVKMPRNPTYVYYVEEQLNTLCEKVVMRPFQDKTFIFKCFGDYQKVKDTIGGTYDHILFVSTSERKRYKCLVADMK